MKKAKLIQTCGGCPSQWEGYTEENEPVYIRFRWGYLSVEIDDKEIFGQRLGDGFDGVLSFEELKQKLEGRLDVEEKMLYKQAWQELKAYIENRLPLLVGQGVIRQRLLEEMNELEKRWKIIPQKGKK